MSKFYDPLAPKDPTLNSLPSEGYSKSNFLEQASVSDRLQEKVESMTNAPKSPFSGKTMRKVLVGSAQMHKLGKSVPVWVCQEDRLVTPIEIRK
jgi:hypothetical protein